MNFTTLLSALVCLLVASPGFAEVLVSDDFPTNGTLTGTTPAVGGEWTTISGTANQIQVVNNRVQLTDSASEDSESGFGTSFTTGNLYFGFDLSVADPGSYTGTDFEYFAHFSGSAFTARTDIGEFTATGYRPGTASGNSTAEVLWGSELSYNTTYRLIVGYDFTTGLATMWVDPSAVTDTSVTSTIAVTGRTLDAFNFRQSAATPDQDFSIGRLRVATTFDEVLLAPPPTIPSLTWYGDGLTAGGSGTWSTAGSNWSDNGGAAGGWDPTKKAVFDTTGGTVTVDGAGVTAETGIDFDVDGYTVTGGGITLGAASNTVTVADGATATIDSVLSDTVTSFEKAGDGTLILGGANTFVGPASISGGRLEVSSEAALGDATNGLVLAGGTFAPTGSLTLGAGRAVSGAGGLDIADGQTLTVNGDYSAGTTLENTGTLDLQGSVRDVGSLTFNAAGTVTAVGGITGSGVTAPTVSSGTATVVPALDLGAGIKTIVVGSGGTLDLQGGLTMTDRMNKDGEGTLILGSGSSIDRLSLGDAFTYAPGGVVRVSNAAALGSQTMFFNVGTVELTAPITMANGISFGGRAGSEAVLGGAGGSEALTVSGDVDFFGGTGTGEMRVIFNNQTTINGGVTLATAASITGLTLGGSGSLTLTADNSTTLTAPVTLADTASLKVTGSIGGNVIVGGTNFLTGTIGKDVNIGGTLRVEIGGANPGRLDVGGTLDITNATVDFDGEPAASTPIIIASYGTLAGTEFATVTDLPAGYTLDYNYNSLKQIALVSDGSPFDTWAATGSMGTVTFNGDTNADGVEDGMAFLLGASSPDVDANGLLPTLSENDGALVLSFSMLNAANRGSASVATQHSSDLGASDAWDAAGNQQTVPEATGLVGTVDFTITPNGSLNDVVATIPSTEANSGSALFARLLGSQ